MVRREIHTSVHAAENLLTTAFTQSQHGEVNTFLVNPHPPPPTPRHQNNYERKDPFIALTDAHGCKAAGRDQLKQCVVMLPCSVHLAGGF